jgi:wobble nucleotide-excising tRNase
MLKKIDFIRNAGLYRSFNWGTLPELKRFNLFYGWNYSGKTTLSRILQSLERGVVPAEFVGCSFQVTHTDGAPLGTGSLLSHAKIRVFNRAFIENNFHQDMAGAKPVVVIGEENQKLKDRMRTLLARREKVLLRQIALTDEAIRKFTDEFSHSHYLRRAMEVPDYVVHCKRMVAEVLEALRTKDPDHIASLDAELAKT